MTDMRAYPRYLISDMKNPHPIRSRYPIFRTLLTRGIQIPLSQSPLTKGISIQSPLTRGISQSIEDYNTWWYNNHKLIFPTK